MDLVIEDYNAYTTAHKMNLVGGVIGEKVQANSNLSMGLEYSNPRLQLCS